MHNKKINTIHVSWLVLQHAALLDPAGQLITGTCSPVRLKGELVVQCDLLCES